MIRGFIFAVFLVVVSSTVAMSQTKTDYNKWEVYGGYSNNQVDTGIQSGIPFRSFFDDRRSFNGFEASGVYNFGRFFGVKGDISGTYNNTRVTFTIPGPANLPNTVSFGTKNSLYNFLGGIQIKDNKSGSRFKPFAHAMIGAGHGITKIGSVDCPGFADCSSVVDNSETGFAGAFGGGLDIRINNHLDFRAIQVDYNPIGFNSGTQNNVRFGIGLVFK